MMCPRVLYQIHIPILVGTDEIGFAILALAICENDSGIPCQAVLFIQVPGRCQA